MAETNGWSVEVLDRGDWALAGSWFATEKEAEAAKVRCQEYNPRHSFRVVAVHNVYREGVRQGE